MPGGAGQPRGGPGSEVCPTCGVMTWRTPPNNGMQRTARRAAADAARYVFGAVVTAGGGLGNQASKRCILVQMYVKWFDH